MATDKLVEKVLGIVAIGLLAVACLLVIQPFMSGAWQSVGDDQAAVGTAISLLLAAMAGYQEVNRSRSVPLRVRVRVCRSR